MGILDKLGLGGGPDGVYTQKPGKIRPELLPAFNKFGQGLTEFANAGPTDVYGGGVAPLSSQTLQGVQDLTTGQPGQAENFYAQNLGFKGIDPNVSNAILNPVRDRVASTFELAGRGGSTAQGVAQTEAEIRALNPLVEAERNRQFTAAQGLGNQAQQRVSNQLIGGGVLDAQAGMEEANQQRIFEQEQNKPYEQISKLGGLISQGTSLYPQGAPARGKGSKLSGLLGGALTGVTAGAKGGLPGMIAGGLAGGGAGWYGS